MGNETLSAVYASLMSVRNLRWHHQEMSTEEILTALMGIEQDLREVIAEARMEKQIDYELARVLG